MAIPPEFNFANEDEFTQEFLIPLLQRLGFSLVVNYHGSSEFGKDLIFAELDRFGHVRYHGLQAKYEPSISLNDVEDLIRDCRQAFSNPFTHPQTGTVERISSFYSINGGSIGPEAIQHYFSSLLPSYGGNARLLQARDLLLLDRWASVSRTENVIAVINGLLVEMYYNNLVVPLWTVKLQQYLEGIRVHLPIERFRTNASSAYLMQPILQNFVSTNEVLRYSNLADMCNRLFELITQGILDPDNRKQLKVDCLANLEELKKRGMLIQSALKNFLQMIGPLAAI